MISELKRERGEVLITLRDNTADEARQFVNSLLDTEPNALGDEFRRSMAQRTRSHPSFAVELLRGMQERGDLARLANCEWQEAKDTRLGSAAGARRGHHRTAHQPPARRAARNANDRKRSG